jgi:YD repeat-containing protein
MKAGVVRALLRLATIGWLVMVASGSLPVPASADVNYIYDESGRLRAATDATGNIAEYRYDAVGNIIEIVRYTSGQLAIIEFTPNEGPVGTSVTIYGSGFSTTPANNTVKFNGTTAAVSSASTALLVATVPVGATTGKISVTVGSSTVTSIDDFTLTSGTPTGPPTITNFTPTIGAAGTQVTVTGTNFDPTSGATRAQLNQVVAKATANSNTDLTMKVPPTTGSGRIKISTPLGSVVSAGDFIVPPPGVAAANIVATTRVSAGGPPQTLNINPAGKYGLVLFDGNKGDLRSLQLSSFSTSPANATVNYALYGPDNVQIQTGFVSSSNLTIHLPIVLSTGTHVIALWSTTASINATLNLGTNAALILDGSATNVSSSIGHSVRYTFNGTTGQRIGLGLTGLTHTPSNINPTLVSVGNSLGQGVPTNGYQCYTSSPGGGCEVDIGPLPNTGTYTVQFTPPTGSSFSGTATLSSDVTNELVPGTLVNLNLSRSGQNASLTINGTAGKSVDVGILSAVTTPANQVVDIRFYKPDGTTELQPTVVTGNSGRLYYLLANLPFSGAYTVVVDPRYAATATVQVVLGQSVPIVVDGASVSVTTTGGEQGVLTFNGVAGQNLGIGLTGLVHTPPSTNSTSFTVYRPDGTFVGNGCVTSSPNGGCESDLGSLTITGLYTVTLMAPPNTNLSAVLSLSSDVVGSLTPNVPYSLAITRAGQNGRLTFSATAGDAVGIEVAGLTTTPANQNVGMSVLRPDGTVLSTVTASPTAGGFINLVNLPSTGTYSVVLDPWYAVTSTMQVTVDTGTPIAIGGSSVNVSTTSVGETVRLTFSGTAGQNLGFGITGLTHTPPSGSFTTITIYRPDGVSLGNVLCATSNPGGGCSYNVGTLPSTGLYTITLRPPASINLAATATLSSDVTGTLTPSTPLPLALARNGQDGRLSFSGTAGGSMGIEVAGLTTTPSNQSVTITVLRPDGVTLASGTATPSAGGFVNLANLPSTGTYTVRIDPSYAATAAMQVTLEPGTPITIDGSFVNVSTTVIGETVRLTFTGTAGQNLGLGLTGLTHTPANSGATSVTVYRPDGTQVVTGNCFTANPGGGCNVNISNLPSTGTYSIVIRPVAGSTMAATVTLSTDVSGTLTLNTPSSLTLNRSGQNGRLTFSGTAGSSVGVEVAALTTTPASQTVTITVLKPDATQLTSGTVSNSGGLINLPTLPTTGTYTVVVDPSYAATATMQVTIESGSPITIDGSAVNVITSGVGESARLTFTGTSGQNLGLGITSLTHTPGSASATTVTVSKPDGTTFATSTCLTANPGGGCELDLINLPTSGTYSVGLLPPGSSTLTATVTLSTDTTGTLTPNTPVSSTLNRSGQNARLTFSGTASGSVGIEVAGLTTTPANQTVAMTVYKPDGTMLASATASTTSGGYINLGNLPVTGTYSVFLDPAYAVTATMQATLEPGTSIAIDGSTVPVSTTVIGERVRLTLSGTAGQVLGLGLTGLTHTPATANFTTVVVYRPDGVTLTSGNCYTASPGGGCELDLAALPVTGTYSVLLTPPASTTLSASMTLSSDVTGSLTPGTPFPLALSRNGQNGRLTFAGTSGTNRTLTFGSVATVPASQSVTVTVYKPDSTYLTSSTITGTSGTINLTNLPSTGTYTVFIDPAYGATATMNVTVSP